MEVSKRPKDKLHPRQKDRPPPLIDLPEKPLLGFGSCGTHFVSPVKIPREVMAKSDAPRSRRKRRSPTRSTSYLSWSQTTSHSMTSSRSAADLARGQKQPACSLPKAHQRSPAAESRQTNTSPKSPNPQFRGAKEPRATGTRPESRIQAPDTQQSLNRLHAREQCYRGSPAATMHRSAVGADKISRDGISPKTHGPGVAKNILSSRKSCRNESPIAQSNHWAEIRRRERISQPPIDSRALPNSPSHTLNTFPPPLSLDTTLDSVLKDNKVSPERPRIRVASVRSNYRGTPCSNRNLKFQQDALGNNVPDGHRLLKAAPSTSVETRRMDATPAHDTRRVPSQGIAGHVHIGTEANAQPQKIARYGCNHPQIHRTNYHLHRSYLPLQYRTMNNRNAWNEYGKLYGQQQDKEDPIPDIPVEDEGYHFSTKVLNDPKLPPLDRHDKLYRPSQGLFLFQSEGSFGRTRSSPYNIHEEALDNGNDVDRLVSREGEEYLPFQQVPEQSARDVGFPEPKPIYQAQLPGQPSLKQHLKLGDRRTASPSDEPSLIPQTGRPQLHIPHRFHHLLDLSRPLGDAIDEPRGFWTPRKLY